MPLDVTALTQEFCAEIDGVDITKPIAPEGTVRQTRPGLRRTRGRGRQAAS